METVLIVSSVLLWIVLICNVLLTLALVRNANKPAKKKWELVSEPEGLKEGAEAPAFSAQTLDGTSVLLEDYQNQALMLVFIAPHCSACDEVLPALNKMASQMAGTKLVLACDGTLEQARVLAKKQDITLPLLVAPRQENSFFSDYLIHGTPTYYLINTQGQIQATGHPSEHNPQWKQLVASLAEQAAQV